MGSPQKRASILALVLVFLVSAVLSVQAATPAVGTQGIVTMFSDVGAQERNVEYIQYISQRGLMSGYPDGTFHPGQGLTRAEAAALLVKTSGLKASDASTPFKDLPAAHWARPAIAAATAAGYLSGYPDGTFRPEQKLTRAEGISLFLRLSKQKSDAALPVLSDMDAKHWAAGQVAEALASGMIGLSADKKEFYPNAPLLRSDLARALAVLLTKDPDLYKAPLTGQLKALAGSVAVIHNGTSNEVKVNSLYTINQGDVIQTADGAKADLSFPDGSGLLIKEKTNITIKELRGRSYIKNGGKPGIAVDWLAVDLKEGTIYGALASSYEANKTTETEKKKVTGQSWNNAPYLVASLGNNRTLLADTIAADKKMPWYETSKTKKVKVQVDMPWGVAAVRGSFWENSVMPDGRSYTNLLTGDVVVSNGGQTVPLAPGQTTVITQLGAPPAPPAPMTPQQVRGWVDNQDWANNRAQQIDNQQPAQEQAPPPAQNQENQGTTPPANNQQQPGPTQPGQNPPAGQTPPGQNLPTPGASLGSVLNTIQSAINNASQNAGLTNPSTSPSGGGSSSGGGGSDTLIPVSISSISSNINVYLYETYELTRNINNPYGAALTFASSNANVIIEQLTTGATYVRGAVPGSAATITVTATKPGYTSSSITFTVSVTDQALAYNEATVISALANSAVNGIRLVPKVYSFITALNDPGRPVSIYCSAGETAIMMIPGSKPTNITIGNGVTLYEDNPALNECVSLIPIGVKLPGQEVILAGSTLLNELLIKVIKPDNTLLYVDIARAANQNYSKVFTLPNNTPGGLYTVVVGQGSTVATRTFYVVTIAQ